VAPAAHGGCTVWTMLYGRGHPLLLLLPPSAACTMYRSGSIALRLPAARR
jgi:hypothetical protein